LVLSISDETCGLGHLMKLFTTLRLACVLALPTLAGTTTEPARKPLDLPTFVVTGRQVTELPPFVVTGFAQGPNWRYASIPGFEIITQCSDGESREIIEAIQRGRQLMLPPEFWQDFAVPMTVVLFNQPPVSSGQPAAFGSTRQPGEIISHWNNLIKRTLDDRESFALNLWPGTFYYSATFRFHTRTLLQRRAPAVPAWLSASLFGGYGIYREGVYWYPGNRTKRILHANWHSREELDAARNLSFEAGKQIDDGTRPLTPSPLHPFLAEFKTLFETDPPPMEDAAEPRWASTAALFARWGIYGRQRPEQAAQFWRFADRASREPVNEQLFHECFGRSYAEVRAELSWYLAIALTEDAITPANIEPLPKIKFRKATNAEVALVRGEWERMESVALATQFPELAESSRTQAAATLNRAYTNGNRDPRLLASLGLLAMDAGDYQTAHNHLEAAVAGHVTGPRVYLETARLRWAVSRLDDEGTLAPEALAGVIDLLMTAEQQGPPLAAVYLLLANATAKAHLVTPAQASALRRGLAYFPRLPDLQARINASLQPRLR
jgi:hypothetical protein